MYIIGLHLVISVLVLLNYDILRPYEMSIKFGKGVLIVYEPYYLRLLLYRESQCLLL